MAKTKSSQNNYSIGAVARITGLTDHTIRVWERRYGAVVAGRTETGRRIYTAANVEKLGLLKQLTDKGLAISKIAGKSNAALKKAVLEYDQVASKSIPGSIAIAVLGESVRAQLVENSGPYSLLVADSSPTRFAADLEKQLVDVVVVETTVLDNEALKRLRAYRLSAKARFGLLVYKYGRTPDLKRANTTTSIALRSPVNVPELLSAINGLVSGNSSAKLPASDQVDQPKDSAWRFSGAIAPRRFTQQQLTHLASISSSIDCECPQNLAQLVSDLTAFEIYSSQCTNRDAEDAALHHYLHQVTAQARQLIEEALDKVVEAEGISV